MDAAFAQSKKDLYLGLKANSISVKSAAIKKIFKTPDASLHKSALNTFLTLPKSSKKKLLPHIIKFYKSASQKIKIIALRNITYANILNPDIEKFLLYNLTKGSKDEKRQILNFLMILGHRSKFAVSTLLNIYKLQSLEFKALILNILGRSQSHKPAILDLLLKSFDENLHIRWQVAYILGNMGIKNHKIVTLLQNGLKDPNNGIIGRCAEALGKINASDKKTIDLLWDLRNSNNAGIRIKSMEALMRLYKNNKKKQRALKIIEEELDNNNKIIKCKAIRTILKADRNNSKAILSLLNLGKTNSGKEAILIIRELHLDNKAAFQFLLNKIKSRRVDIRILALSALWRIKKYHNKPSESFFKKLYYKESDLRVRKYLKQILQ